MGADWSFMRLVRSDVMVPGMVVGVGDFGPDDFDDARAGLDQPAGQETALAKRIAAVTVAHLFGFLSQVERFAGAAGNDQIQSALVIIVEVVVLDGLVDVRHGFLDGIAQSGAALQAQGKHFRRQLEIIDIGSGPSCSYPCHRPREERVGIVGFAEEPGGAAFADHVGFLERARQHDERQHRFGRPGAGGRFGNRSSGKSFGSGGSSWPDGTDFVGRVAGHDLIDGRGMVEQAVRAYSSSNGSW